MTTNSRDGCRARPPTVRLPVTPAMTTLAWGLISLFGFISVPTVLLVPIGPLEQAVHLQHSIALATWAFAWVIGGGLIALAAGRIMFGAWLPVHPRAWLGLFVGAIVSAAQVSSLATWATARFGYYDPEFTGPTSILFAVVAGVAVAGFGARVAPRWALWLPLLAVLVG